MAANVVHIGKAPADAMRYAVLTSDHRWAFCDDGDDPAYAELGSALRHFQCPVPACRRWQGQDQLASMKC
ncbi:hypothetical protein AB4Y42_39035 [Paraburkholderia sp. EG286B]|uniref:hypothetical protein n=1 Tax=Paraburkholderia sp. EG286B TaxID=3237011 RepID=UPI0034D1F268